eukprot:764652-Hanusia_phi.AAC.6
MIYFRHLPHLVQDKRRDEVTQCTGRIRTGHPVTVTKRQDRTGRPRGRLARSADDGLTSGSRAPGGGVPAIPTGP